VPQPLVRSALRDRAHGAAGACGSAGNSGAWAPGQRSGPNGAARIWPTNNISERGVRPTKTQQKISGRLTSEDATQDRLDIRSYIDTARKHGNDALTVLRGLMTGNPWRPAPAANPP
jgi:hypothetical protein